MLNDLLALIWTANDFPCGLPQVQANHSFLYYVTKYKAISWEGGTDWEVSMSSLVVNATQFVSSFFIELELWSCYMFCSLDVLELHICDSKRTRGSSKLWERANVFLSLYGDMSFCTSKSSVKNTSAELYIYRYYIYL